MGIMTKTLKGLFPPDWSLVKDLRACVEALSLSFERIRVFLNGVITESEPSTAVETLEEWFTQEGINYDPSQSTARLQDLANQSYSNTGGQSPAYLNEQIQKAFPDVYVEENLTSPELMVGSGMVGLMMVTDFPISGADPWFLYTVRGEVDSVSDLDRIKNFLDKIMPVPYEPVFAVTIRNLTPSGMVGLGMVGLMMVGREN